MKSAIFTFYFILSFVDLIFFSAGNSGDGVTIYLLLIILQQPLLLSFYFIFLYYLITERFDNSKFQKNIILLLLVVSLDIVKIGIFNYHPFLPIFSALDLKSESEKMIKEQQERRAKYKSLYSSTPFLENTLFENDKLQTDFQYNGPINRVIFHFKKDSYLILNDFIDLKYANMLSFENVQNYSTETSTTLYDKLIEYRTESGRISFLILKDTIQSCIHDDSFLQTKFEFLNKCNKKSAYYTGFWDSILVIYCSQRKLNFRYSNECDTVRY